MTERNSANFAVTSSQFKDGDRLPLSVAHSMAGGQNTSPALEWDGAPAGAASFALSLYDPDAPTPVGFVHWLLFNIDGSVQGLAPGAGATGKNPPGSVLGLTDFGASEYGGPAPPPGDPPHHYEFTVYALDLPRVDLGPTTTYAMLSFMIRGHVLGQGKLIGIYSR